MGATGHHRVSMPLDLQRQCVTELGDQHDKPVEGLGQLQAEAGIHDVLGGRTVVEGATFRLRQSLGELPHQGQDGIADIGHVSPQRGQVDVVQPAGGSDGLHPSGRDLADGGLGSGQRGLRAQPGLDRGGLGEDGLHEAVAEGALEHGEDSRGRVASPAHETKPVISLRRTLRRSSAER